MSLLFAIVSLTMLAQTLRTTIPYACAALGGVWSERSGVVNIALEGLLLASGLAAVVGAHATGNPWIGVACGVGVSASIALVHALLVVYGGVDAIVSGIALNLVAAGGTRFVMRALYDSSSNSPAVDGFRFGNDGAAQCAPRTGIAAVANSGLPPNFADGDFHIRTSPVSSLTKPCYPAGLPPRTPP